MIILVNMIIIIIILRASGFLQHSEVLAAAAQALSPPGTRLPNQVVLIAILSWPLMLRLFIYVNCYHGNDDDAADDDGDGGDDDVFVWVAF